MVKVIDIQAELAARPVLEGRTPATSEEEADAAFATLSPYRDGGIFAGRFVGDSEWERHRNGDEIVHVLDGATELTILTEAGPEVVRLGAGMLAVVPEGHWHRFHAPDGVTLMTVTPQPTDHTTALDPREAE